MIPNDDRLEKDREKVVRPAEFQKYLDGTVSLSLAMIREGLAFVEGQTRYDNKNGRDLLDMYEEKKKAFPLLRKNWNMDCGIGFRFKDQTTSALRKAPKAQVRLPLQMHLTAAKDLSGTD